MSFMNFYELYFFFGKLGKFDILSRTKEHIEEILNYYWKSCRNVEYFIF